MIKADLSLEDQTIFGDLARADRLSLPVNIIYPPNYPEEPAIVLDGPILPSHALEAFDRLQPEASENANE